MAKGEEQQVWQARPGLLYRPLVDGGMIYDGESGQVHHLNATAAQVWEGCRNGATREELAAVLCSRYAVEVARAQADVARILEHFAGVRLLQP
ncbi:MAG: HPr-rel-A system PqqD family peptide chaperone [Candidatus Latescibacteria bacterium]|nr:HPr-rel-A system PqqD family peptide chaperone [Candidatus Latescibacterota bacterium]